MSKKNRNAQPPRQQGANTSQPKLPGSLIQGLVSAVSQSSQAVGSERPDWDESVFDSLNAALPENKREEFHGVLNQFMELGKSVQVALTRSKAAETAASVAREKVDEDSAQLDMREKAISEKEIEVNAGLGKLAEREAAMVSTQKDIEIREANARANFFEENNQALKQLRDDISRLETQKLTLHSELMKQREEALQKIRDDTAQVVLKLAQKQQEVEKAAGEIEAERASIDLQKLRRVRERQSDEQLESLIRNELTQDMAAITRKKDNELEKWREKTKRLAEELDEARNKLDSFNSLEIELAGRSAISLIEEASDLRRQCRDKNARILQLESDSASDETAALRKERDLLEEKLRNLRPELEELKDRSSQFDVGVREKEQWAMERRALHKHKELLSIQLNDLESRIKGLTEAQGNQGAFPELGRMDTDFKFNTPASVQPISNLKKFVEELQHRIAASQPGNPLYFLLDDLQLFVGGLAMSQLHVLQGISGTGKTSLAKAFAKAVGGECTDIAVQAGWRDRADLLGHYNAFEKKFYEKDCLQALYKAQTPAFSDRVNVVLLDEMNLSRPEQYFADFLSALEKEPGDRRVPLMESAPANAPKLLRDGREILLPENVWFIGTANQDETTNELADKTYDRAFVMELPRHEGRFDFNADFDGASYQYQSLKGAFLKVQKREEAAVREVLKFIAKSELTKGLEEQFDIGWGNRFERQALKFLPVVKAAGGSYETAIDHLLSTRIFRAGKVTKRYDTDKDDLKAIEKALTTTLKSVFPNIVPKRCLTAIEKDLRRLEKGA